MAIDTDQDGMPAPPDDAELEMLARLTGPMLHMRGAGDGKVSLSALLMRPVGQAPGVLHFLTDDGAQTGSIQPHRLATHHGIEAWRYDFDIPLEERTAYRLEGTDYAIDAHWDGDIRIAFVSCNGQEDGDRERDAGERNIMWRRLSADNEDDPFQLLLHGGDQLYADEVLKAHPLAKRWEEEDEDPDEYTDEQVEEVREALSRTLFRRYLEIYGEPEMVSLLSSVPSLAIWDDHDICDGWGSLPSSKLDSRVGRAIFDNARTYFLLFQQAATEDDLPRTFLDRTGRSACWQVSLPGVSVIAPDLRSERRLDRVMDETGWQALQEGLDRCDGERVIVVSSVPALGPRLSVFETLMNWASSMQEYEDDLRDQWQSRMHRDEWRRFLRMLIEVHARPSCQLTVLSGEIHLATRGTMQTKDGPIHQLVASGISHPPPAKIYATALSTLARLGEQPVKGHPIKLHALPGFGSIYKSRRNYLVLSRKNRQWSAIWELDEEGATAPLDIS